MSAYINIKIVILGETTITGKFSSKITVEQIKRWVFSNSPSLFSVGKEQFVIGVSPTEIILDEQLILIESHKILHDLYQAGELIEVHIYPKSIEQTQIEKLKNLYDVNSPLHSYDNAQIEGFLIKRGKSVQSWKRRYCILQNNFISYFKLKTEKIINKYKKDSTPIGAIPIQDCIYCARCTIVGRKNAFAVHTRTRTFYLTAESVREANDWIATVNKCMEKLGIVPVDPKDQNGVAFTKIEKEGYLYKTGSQSKGWKRRYFRMEGRFMYYFKTPKAMTPLGCIPLQDVRIIDESESGDKKKIYKFVLQTRHRNYNLYADDLDSFNEWKRAIQTNISTNVFQNDTNVPSFFIY